MAIPRYLKIGSPEWLAREEENKDKKPNLNTSFLCYCNWSYAKKYHLKEEEALIIFDEFDEDKTPFYIRIFNEMPENVLNKFLERNKIPRIKVFDIYNQLSEMTSRRLRPFPMED